MGLETDEVREWLLGFDKATLKHDMTMQMCMQLPSNLLQSLEMDSVTNAVRVRCLSASYIHAGD